MNVPVKLSYMLINSLVTNCFINHSIVKQRNTSYYHSHPKDGESVCPFIGGRGYPRFRFFPRSLVPCPFQEVYPTPGREDSPVLARRVPHSWLGVGGAPVLAGGTPWLGLGYPLGQDWVSPKTEQQSEKLLCSGWYAFCSDAG